MLGLGIINFWGFGRIKKMRGQPRFLLQKSRGSGRIENTKKNWSLTKTFLEVKEL